jgi:hypothetical protein
MTTIAPKKPLSVSKVSSGLLS